MGRVSGRFRGPAPTPEATATDGPADIDIPFDSCIMHSSYPSFTGADKTSNVIQRSVTQRPQVKKGVRKPREASWTKQLSVVSRPRVKPKIWGPTGLQNKVADQESQPSVFAVFITWDPTIRTSGLR